MSGLWSEKGVFIERVGRRGCSDLSFLQVGPDSPWPYVGGCPERDTKIKRKAQSEILNTLGYERGPGTRQ
jgi:hypothetical protein